MPPDFVPTYAASDRSGPTSGTESIAERSTSFTCTTPPYNTAPCSTTYPRNVYSVWGDSGICRTYTPAASQCCSPLPPTCMTPPPPTHTKGQSQLLKIKKKIAYRLLLPSSLRFSASGMAKLICVLLQLKMAKRMKVLRKETTAMLPQQ
ncbi:uncharacterized protein MONOS_11648 [Monocercomonoides exilis]|uniref:uncharacterized protein n=1 Tax=Monocercomonoides exilis TaxID=2049356 RepID=UPI003559C5B1|nr:hypothetical protein MONOS_11648 [Monocercomonoides exilis]|eukprot:MONOS_11648.1-p1 / transcript=MONOS_11648.1 / gene=MONOS_11648 / organism=Monocercomonoides_exilis_PA203 / gene_product=unspecified product / transcript_product=unspecified product / location=Mono_scaffold00597:21546-21992(-) / protein_length=149 / sequence_SO=supercontig / SO=protein_coding / is_pseudo=false